jgi:hypothetical protein
MQISLKQNIPIGDEKGGTNGVLKANRFYNATNILGYFKIEINPFHSIVVSKTLVKKIKHDKNR